MLIKINRDSFIESSSIEQYYLDGVKIIFYISSRKHEEIYDSEEAASSVFNRVASSFRDATTEPVSKPTEQKLAEKQRPRLMIVVENLASWPLKLKIK